MPWNSRDGCGECRGVCGKADISAGGDRGSCAMVRSAATRARLSAFRGTGASGFSLLIGVRPKWSVAMRERSSFSSAAPRRLANRQRTKCNLFWLMTREELRPGPSRSNSLSTRVVAGLVTVWAGMPSKNWKGTWRSYISD